jgi:hypothetical protein
MQIRKAERKKAKLRLGISGASNSGKTWSALEIATGIGGKIGMIETEGGKGELYSDLQSKYNKDMKLSYDVISLKAPFTPKSFIDAIKKFESENYDVIIIDSLSHAWNGEGGILTMVGDNGWFSKLGVMASKEQNRLVEAILNCKAHLICNFRAKMEYVMETNETGKSAPRKVGLAPVQREGMEYEFLVFMNMQQIGNEHIATISKDNTEILEPTLRPSPEIGKKLVDWLNRGVEVFEAPSQEEQFKGEILPLIIDDFNDCRTQDELKEKFGEYTKKHRLSFMIEAIIAAKDKRKDQINAEEAGKSVDKTMDVATRVISKHSQNLTNLARL